MCAASYAAKRSVLDADRAMLYAVAFSPPLLPRMQDAIHTGTTVLYQQGREPDAAT